MADISAFGQLLLLSAIMLIVVYLMDLLVIFDIIKITPIYEYVISVAAGIILGTSLCVLMPLASDYQDIFVLGGGDRDLTFPLSGLFTSVGVIVIMILNRISGMEKYKGKISPVLFLHSFFDGCCLGFPAAADDFSNSTIVMIILALHRILMTLALTSNLLKKHTRNEVLIGMFGFGVAALVGSLVSFGIAEAFSGTERFAAIGYGSIFTAGSFIAAVFDDIFPDMREGSLGFNPKQQVLFSVFTAVLALLPLNYN